MITYVMINLLLNSDIDEPFKAHNLDNPETDLLDQIPDDDITSGKHTHYHIVNHLSAKETIDMMTDIKKIIVDKIVEYGTTCQQMNGDEVGFSDGKINISLACVSDPYAVEEDIVLEVTKYIRTVIKNKFNIDLSPYIVIADLLRELNLLEGVIYPSQHSHLYTVHRVQYTNRRIIEQIVNTNINVRHVLYTVLSRRNITLEIDTDQHIY